MALEKSDPLSKVMTFNWGVRKNFRKKRHLKCRLRIDRIPLDRDVRVKRRAFLEEQTERAQCDKCPGNKQQVMKSDWNTGEHWGQQGSGGDKYLESSIPCLLHSWKNQALDCLCGFFKLAAAGEKNLGIFI